MAGNKCIDYKSPVKLGDIFEMLCPRCSQTVKNDIDIYNAERGTNIRSGLNLIALLYLKPKQFKCSRDFTTEIHV